MRQLIIAIHNHETVEGHYPPRFDERESWKEMLLPYLEKQKTEFSSNGRATTPIAAVPQLICPSDVAASSERALLIAGNNYVLNDGHGETINDGFAGTATSPLRPVDIVDGLSNTAALSERLVVNIGNKSLSMPDESLFWNNRVIRYTANFEADYDRFADECQQNSTIPKFVVLVADNYSHIQTPNRRSCQNGRTHAHMALTPSSLHGPIVNVAFVDGAIKAMNETIDRTIWRSIGTRAGKEVATDF